MLRCAICDVEINFADPNRDLCTTCQTEIRKAVGVLHTVDIEEIFEIEEN